MVVCPFQAEEWEVGTGPGAALALGIFGDPKFGIGAAVGDPKDAVGPFVNRWPVGVCIQPGNGAHIE